jgi:hypothetical protein
MHVVSRTAGSNSDYSGEFGTSTWKFLHHNEMLLQKRSVHVCGVIITSPWSEFFSGPFSSVSPPKPCIPLLSPHTCYMSSPSDYPCFDYPNNTWWGILTMKLLVMLSSPVSHLDPIFLNLLLNTLIICFSFNVRDKFHTHTQNNGQNCSSLCLHLHVLDSNQKVTLLKTLFRCGGNLQLGPLVTHGVFIQRLPPTGPHLTLRLGHNSVM